MSGTTWPAEVLERVIDLLASGMAPTQVARLTGVSSSYAYRVRGGYRPSGVVCVPMRFSREREREVLDALASGLTPAQAARATGVSSSSAYRVQRKVGGMFRPPGSTFSDRYLDREQRYEIARLRDGGNSMRAIATKIGCDVSTVSRELARNSDTQGGYQPERADRWAWERQRRPKPSKIASRPDLAKAVQGMLDRRYSPEQISGRLELEHPDNVLMRLSPETIYQSLFVYPRGELVRELKASLRSGRAARRTRGQRQTRATIPNLVSIHDRPDEVEGRLVPGHHEGDLIKGSMASNSAVGTIVERTTGYLTLLHLPQGYKAEMVADAVVAQMSALPTVFTKTLTWDRGSEMARHATITERTNIDVFFADPYSPHQRGSNENTVSVGDGPAGLMSQAGAGALG